MSEFEENKESLWLLVLSPTIWAMHFLLSYMTAAVVCAKTGNANDSIDSVQIFIAVLTLIAVAGIGWTAIHAYRRHKTGVNEPVPHLEDKPGDRHRFMGFASLLLCGISAVATVYVALVAVFFENCY